MPKKNYHQDIISFIKIHPKCTSQDILNAMEQSISIATLKRVLQQLIANGMIVTTGQLKGTKYEISPFYDVIKEVDVKKYFEKEIDERVIQSGYNFNLISSILPQISIFKSNETERLNQLQVQFKNSSTKLSASEYKSEMERLAIDLSWKSSQIEGNTYSLLETEILLKDKITASGKTQHEALMLLNHKAAIDFIVANPEFVNPLSVSAIEDIHSILIKNLEIDRNIRTGKVGISGTNYRPLDNAFQIKEALEMMCQLISSKNSVFEKALLALVLISYIQPFVDGNKRTARIICNAILLQHHYCPISFRTVDSIDYKKAMLVFYEQMNISPIKSIFIEQFEFAVQTYF